MWKRLWKNAILALCVLALVLQPVVSFASSDLVYYSNDFLFSSLRQYLNRSNLTFVKSNTEAYLNDLYLPIALLWEEYGNNYLYSIIKTSSNSQNYTYIAIDKNKFYIYRQSSSVIMCKAITAADYYYVNIPQSSIGTDSVYDAIENIQSISLVADDIQVFLNSYFNVLSYVPNNGFYLYAGPQNDYKFLLDTTSTYNSSIPNSSTPSPNEPASNDANFGEYLLFKFIQSNFFYQQQNEFLNQTWTPVGQALTYDYLCKTNKDCSTVTITLADGTEVSLDNYLYGDVNYSSDLSSIKNTLSDINTKFSTNNSHLNTINNSINNQMNSINNKLNAAFPSSQAAINDFIAEDLMDDTNGNGMTINRIAQSKSDLDDGLDTFKLDTSQSQYSNPFSALGDADWSFWSQTTLINLGSGYSYSFGEGSLMSEDDVFTENQSVLLNLLGW